MDVPVCRYTLAFSHFPERPPGQRHVLTDQKAEGDASLVPPFFLKILEETGKQFACSNDDYAQFRLRFEEGAPSVLEGSSFNLYVCLLENHWSTMQELCQSKATFSVDFATEVVQSGKSGGQATGWLRYPHMLHRMFRRFKSPKNICIAGPGITELNGTPTSPIVLETLFLFPKVTTVTVLDKDKPSLTVLCRQLSDGLQYDPTNADFTSKGVWLPVKVNPKYRSFYEKFLTFPREVNLKQQIKPAVFDFATSDLKKLGRKYDIIIATNSLWYPMSEKMAEGDPNPIFPILTKFLKELEENGALYIDIQWLTLLQALHGPGFEKVAYDYLEILVGSKLRIEKLPISEFFPEIEGDFGLVNNLKIEVLNKTQEGPLTISSTSVMEITRLPEATELSSEEQGACLAVIRTAREEVRAKMAVGLRFKTQVSAYARKEPVLHSLKGSWKSTKTSNLFL